MQACETALKYFILISYLHRKRIESILVPETELDLCKMIRIGQNRNHSKLNLIPSQNFIVNDLFEYSDLIRTSQAGQRTDVFYIVIHHRIVTNDLLLIF